MIVLMEERAPDIKTQAEAQAAVEELNIQRSIMAFIHDPENFDLLERPSTEVFSSLVAELPDKPVILNKDAAADLSEKIHPGGRPSPLDHGVVQPLESFLFMKVSLENHEVLQFSESGGTTGEFFSAADSASMIRDTIRTKRFLMGVEKAVQAKLESQDGVIRVCDAGCGALPILGLQAAILSDRVECVCLETNPQAVAIAETLIASFGLSDRVKVVVQDAKSYEPEDQFDVVVSETMDTGLLNEPMCSILSHLQQHTRTDALMLPSSVSTYAAIISENEFHGAQTYTVIDQDIKPVLDPDWVLTGIYVAGDAIPELQGEIPISHESGELLVLVSSEVNVFDEVQPISFNESRLSVPQVVNLTKDAKVAAVDRNNKQSVSIAYSPGDQIFDVSLD